MGPTRSDPFNGHPPFSTPSQTPTSPNMKCNIKEGTFVNKKGPGNKEFLDFMIKCGCPPADANKMMEKGMTTKIEIAKIGEKTWRVIYTCKEIPTLNNIYVLDENKEGCFQNNAIGGTDKVTISCPDENTMKIITDNSKLGKSETHEVYTDNGITITTKHSSGATMTEHWDRECCEEGAYRYVGSENGEAFYEAMKKSGEDVKGLTFEDIQKDSAYMLKALGADTWQLTDHILGQTTTMTVPMNKEVDYTFPGYEKKMLWTRISPNKVKMITKNKDGSTWDIMRTQLASGDHLWECKDNKSGTECKMMYERFTCMDGVWKPVCIEGAEAFGKAMGAGDKLAKDSANDYDQNITVHTKAGGYWTVCSDSKVFPYNITYKLDEEFEWDMSGVPGMPEGMDLKVKCRETCVGKDKYVMVGKHPEGKVTKSVTEVTQNFMVKKDYLVGSNISSTIILMRC